MIGWVLLSRDSVARAAEALEGEARGVRDEVGFLSLHQSISDRLFPGTSVLHTRARYAVLVPWLMIRVAEKGTPDADRRLQRAETDLARQLAEGQRQRLDAKGAIGVRVLPRSAAQPASFSYWSALSVWKILAPRPDGRVPTRSQALRRLAGVRSARPGSEDDPLNGDDVETPFIDLPPMPADLGDPSKPMDLALTKEEAKFLRRQLIGVLKFDGAQSLLARLVDVRAVPSDEAAWKAPIAQYADHDDRTVLKLAHHASSLTAIGRGVYAALVEIAFNHDRNGRSTKHQEQLAALRARYGEAARQLDVQFLLQTFPDLNSDLGDVLTHTLLWLRTDGRVESLQSVYTAAESSRKRDRARLGSSLAARRRRDEWDPSLHPEAGPLNYRWSNIKRLLEDLAG